MQRRSSGLCQNWQRKGLGFLSKMCPPLFFKFWKESHTMWHKGHPDKPEPDLQEGQGRHAMHEFRCHRHLFCWHYITELTLRLVFQTLFCYVFQDSPELGNGGLWCGRTSRTAHSLFSHRDRTNRAQMWNFWCQEWPKKKKRTRFLSADTLALHEEDFNNVAIRKQRVLFRPDHLG